MFDLHCHILPGVDDGARSVTESRDMLRAAKKQGIDTIMCTPHCRWSSFDRSLIRAAFSEMEKYANDLGVSLQLGYEVNWRKLFELGIERAPEFTLGDTNLFLLELSDDAMPTNWQRLIYSLQSMDLQVIIAHPERYRAVQKNLEIARELKNIGCYLQLSANFIEGGAFDARRRTASALLREDLVDYVASDAHRVSDYATFARALAFCRQ